MKTSKQKENDEQIKQKEIPIFFACDDNYIPFLAVALHSLIKKASDKYNYKIIILNTGIKQDYKNKIFKFENKNFKIEFFDITKTIKKYKDLLSVRLRDYYSDAIYYRMFIPSLFPMYDKAIYLDGDLVVLEDISKFFNIDIQNYYVAGINDQIITSNEDFSNYSKNAVGIEPSEYFNSGVLLMNLKKFRDDKIEEKFLHLLKTYNFDTLAPDQDYLNVLCKGKALLVDLGWDKMPIPNKDFQDETLKIVHYNCFDKPWHFSNVLYGELFWYFAKETDFYNQLLNLKKKYSQKDIENDKIAAMNLVKNAQRIVTEDPATFKIILG